MVYAEWKAKFDIPAHQSDISNLLVCCSHVRTLHSQLVPAQVSYEAFWMRYFFKVQQLQKASTSYLSIDALVLVFGVTVMLYIVGRKTQGRAHGESCKTF